MDMLPPWLVPTVTAVTTALSAIVLWGFVTGRWVQGRAEDHDAIAKLKRELERVRDHDHSEVARLRVDVEKLEDERRQWSERVNIDLGRLQGHMASEEKVWLLRVQHLGDEIQSLDKDVEDLKNRVSDLQRQIDQRGRRN